MADPRATYRGGIQVAGQPRGTFIDRLFGRFSLNGSNGTADLPPPPDPEKTLGVGGAQVYGGYLQSAEKDRALTGIEKYRTFSEILHNNPIVALGVRHMNDLICKPTWRVDAVDESQAAQDAAEFVEDVLYDMATPWNRVVRRMAMYRFHGFSVHEWTAKKRDDGRIGFLDVETRPQVTITRWQLDAFGTVHGIVQRSPQDGVEHYLPIGKCVHLVDDSESDSPEGLGIFRHCVESAKRIARYRTLEGIGYETDLRGVPMASVPLEEINSLLTSGDPQKVAAAKASLEVIRTFMLGHVKNGPDSGLVLDSATYRDISGPGAPSAVRKWAMDLMQGGATTTESIIKSIEREALWLASLFGIEHMLIGGSSRGSQALSRDKAMTFAITCDSTLAELVDAVEVQLLRPLWKLNGFDPATIPTLGVEKIQYRDVEQITSALQQMAQAGAVMMPDDPAVPAMREVLGLPSPDPKQAAAAAQLTLSRPKTPAPNGKPTGGPASGGQPEAVPKTDKQTQGA